MSIFKPAAWQTSQNILRRVLKTTNIVRETLVMKGIILVSVSRHARIVPSMLHAAIDPNEKDKTT